MIDALLDNYRFQQLEEEWIKRGHKQFSLLIQLNRFFKEEAKKIGEHFSHRLLLTRVFRQRLGFTENEFQGLLHQIDSRIKKGLSGLNDLTAKLATGRAANQAI